MIAKIDRDRHQGCGLFFYHHRYEANGDKRHIQQDDPIIDVGILRWNRAAPKALRTRTVEQVLGNAGHRQDGKTRCDVIKKMTKNGEQDAVQILPV